MKKAKRLKRGSKIAIISPSSGAANRFPHIYELGLKNLAHEFGVEIVEFSTARLSSNELYLNPKQRAEDINKAFGDKSIDGIITSLGGYESVRILPYLDIKTILENPKIIMGYSDATTFLSYLNILGMVTFYGPTIMGGFTQLKHLPEEFKTHVHRMLFDGTAPYEYKPYPKWTNGYMDWNNKDNDGECKEFNDNGGGWKYLQGEGLSEGRLWGGNIEVLEFLKGTDYWPQKTFWEDKVLFLETSEEKPSPSSVGYMLRNYGMQGILQKVKGIMIARPKDYSNEEKEELFKVIRDILNIEFDCSKLPVVVDVDFGHTDPRIILPYGCRVQLDPAKNSITLMESPFEDA